MVLRFPPEALSDSLLRVRETSPSLPSESGRETRSSVLLFLPSCLVVACRTSLTCQFPGPSGSALVFSDSTVPFPTGLRISCTCQARSQAPSGTGEHHRGVGLRGAVTDLLCLLDLALKHHNVPLTIGTRYVAYHVRATSGQGMFFFFCYLTQRFYPLGSSIECSRGGSYPCCIHLKPFPFRCPGKVRNSRQIRGVGPDCLSRVRLPLCVWLSTVAREIDAVALPSRRPNRMFAPKARDWNKIYPNCE